MMELLSNISLITEDVPKLAEFYADVLQTETDRDAEHVVIPVQGGGITLYAKAAAERDMGFRFDRHHGNGMCKFSFLVDDVDAEYERLRTLNRDIEFMTAPTTYPWGARSMHFRDPDGNIVCFVARA